MIVGANDGMLHGYDADTGVEAFAYVPRAVLSEPDSDSDTLFKLAWLADPAYTHRFYVDGSPWIGDAYWGGAWRTVVVGATGAGGKGGFALDASNPTACGRQGAVGHRRGQPDPNLGYTIGQAVIGCLNDGHF